MLEIDYISGYNIDIIRKEEINTLQKKEILTKLETKNKNIKEELIKTLEENGILVCLVRKKVIYAINIYEFNDLKEYEFVKSIVTDEVDEKDVKKFKTAAKKLIENMSPIINTEKVQKNSKSKKNKEGLSITIMLCCLILGILSKHIIFGVNVGLLLGLFIYYKDDIKFENDLFKKKKKKDKNKKEEK